MSDEPTKDAKAGAEPSRSGAQVPPPDSATKSGGTAAETVVKLIVGLATPLVLAFLGFLTDDYLRTRDKEQRSAAETRANMEQKVQLYSQLMSRREEAESQLRSAMFQKIIDAFVEPGDDPEIEEQLLSLELLVYNFHDSLDLGPLFLDLKRRLNEGQDKSLTRRLDDLAREVNRKQVLTLSVHGSGEVVPFNFEPSESTLKKWEDARGDERKKLCAAPFDAVVNIPAPPPDDEEIGSETQATPAEDGSGLAEVELRDIGMPELKAIGYWTLAPEGSRTNQAGERIEIGVGLTLEAVNPVTEELRLRMEVAAGAEKQAPQFWISSFDFPMINNTRVNDGQRLAVVLSDFDVTLQDNDGCVSKGVAEIRVVAFPEAYASLKDRTFFQDILERLVDSPTLPAVSAAPQRRSIVERFLGLFVSRSDGT